MPVSSSFALVGREQELEALLRSVSAAKAGQGEVVLLEGEAGIGKSRLLEEALQAASLEGLRTLKGSARELERDRPFGAIADALQLREHSDVPELVTIRDLLTGGEASGELRFRIVDLVFDLLERWSQEAPVLLGLEDLHWADTSTLLVLDRVGRQAPALPVLLLATSRPSPRSRDLTVTLEAVAPQVVRLHPLDSGARLELAAAVLDAPPGESLKRKLEAAGGNPLFETELVAALRDEGAIVLEEGFAEVADRDLPPSLRLTILSRLGFLPEETLDVLRIASVFGSAFRVEHLSRVANRSPADLLAALDPALRAEMILERDDQMAFRHDLVRDAVYEDLPSGVRAGLHREVGRALLATGASAIDAARHVALGATPGDQEAVEALMEAARQAVPRAPASAVEFLSRALELVEAGNAARAGILAELAIALDKASHSQEAEARAVEALAEPAIDEETAVKAAWGVVWGLAGQGRDRDAIAFLSRFMDEHDLPAVARAHFLLTRGQARVFVSDLEGAEADLKEGQRLVAEEEDDPVRATILTSIALLRYVRGRAEDALAILDGAIAVAEASVATDQVIPARGLRISALISLDRFDEASREGRDLALFAERRGLSGTAGAVHAKLATILLASGEWQEVQAEVETAEALFGPGGEALTPIRAELAFHRNDTRVAESEIAWREGHVAQRRSRERLQRLDHVRALVLEAAGRADEALAIYKELTQSREGFLDDASRWTPDAVRVAVAAADSKAADRFAGLAEAAAEALGSASARSAALRSRGLAEGDFEHLREAVALAKESPRPLERALTLEDAARLCPDDPQAVLFLDEALQILDGLGADRHSRRVRAALRNHGVRLGRAPSARAKIGWDALTESERRVVDLVAEGLRNRQIAERLFISIRTVESHLSSAFTKVGVRSRVELTAAALAAQRGEHP